MSSFKNVIGLFLKDLYHSQSYTIKLCIPLKLDGHLKTFFEPCAKYKMLVTTVTETHFSECIVTSA